MIKQFSYLLILIFLISCKENVIKEEPPTVNHQIQSETVPESNNGPVVNITTASSFDPLKELKGKSPKNTKLLINPILTDRLIKLISEEKYQFIKSNWELESPIEFINNVLITSGCQKKDCKMNNFIIVIEYSKDALHVGIKQGVEIKTYSEDGGKSPRIKVWEQSQTENEIPKSVNINNR
jgi:hypothetical protein